MEDYKTKMYAEIIQMYEKNNQSLTHLPRSVQRLLTIGNTVGNTVAEQPLFFTVLLHSSKAASVPTQILQGKV